MLPVPDPDGDREADWASGLNAAQRAAVDHGDGPLLILAGAGTGKTRTLVCRVARLIERGVPPERILAVTFSRRAADELVRRVAALVGPAVGRRVQAGTFHAVAHRVLRRHGLGGGTGDAFTVLDLGDAAELMGLVRSEVAGEARASADRASRFPRRDTLVGLYSRVVSAGRPLTEVVAEWYPWCATDTEAIARVFQGYTARKRTGGMLDFDDLLLHWRAATADPVLGPVLAGTWDHILVDEYQDTNRTQADILRALRRTNGNITAVGDDAQAIYSFRAATVRNILDFPDHFPGAAVVVLADNYRSTQPILDLAGDVAEGLSEGGGRRLRSAVGDGARPVLATCADEATQCDAVCDLILEHLEAGVALREQAVLFRSAHHSDLLEVELRRRNIPFVKYGGLRFLEAAHVRDLVAALRLLDNPADELAWHRMLLLFDGVGPVRAARLAVALGVRPGDDPDVVRSPADDPVARLVAADGPFTPRSASDVGLVAALDACRGDRLAPAEQVELLAAAFEPVIRARYDSSEVRLRDLTALGRLASRAESRAELVADLTLDPPSGTGDLAGPPSLDDDYLTLSTVHSAKGGEWTAVHVIHAADGMFPSDLSTGSAEGVDEERRLFYVALTRARRHLHVYVPLRYHYGGSHGRGDRHGLAPRTRFLPPDLDHRFDHRAVRSGPADTGSSAVAASRSLGGLVDAELSVLWGSAGA